MVLFLFYTYKIHPTLWVNIKDVTLFNPLFIIDINLLSSSYFNKISNFYRMTSHNHHLL